MGQIIQLIDSYTKENVNYEETAVWHDGAPMDDGMVDNIVYRKKGNKYYVDSEFLSGKRINMKRFGVITETDCTNLFKKLEKYKNIRVFIPDGNYYINDQLKFTGNIDIEFSNNAVLNFTQREIISSKVEDVLITGGDPVALPSLSAAVNKNERTIVFSQPHGLIEGDVFTIKDETEFSYSSFRPYYKKGEMCQVQSVIDVNTVSLQTPLYDNYDVNVILYKLQMISPKLRNVNILSKATSEVGSVAIKMRYLKNSTITFSKASGTNNSHVTIHNSFKCTVRDLFVDKHTEPIGYNYGLTIANSQHILIDNCHLSAGRHAITTGGGNDITSIINRDIKIVNSILNSKSTNAFGPHGNTEFYKIKNCTLLNGAYLAGDYADIESCDIYVSASTGLGILFSEIKGANFNVRNNNIYITSPLSDSNVGRGAVGAQIIADRYGHINIEGNNFFLLLDNVGEPFVKYIDIYSNGAKIDVSVKNNIVHSELPVYGVRITGKIKNLLLDNNDWKNCSVSATNLTETERIVCKNNRYVKTNSVIRNALSINNSNSTTPCEMYISNEIIDSPIGAGQLILGNSQNTVLVKNNYCKNPAGNATISSERRSTHISGHKLVIVDGNAYGDVREVMKTTRGLGFNTVQKLVIGKNYNFGGDVPDDFVGVAETEYLYSQKAAAAVTGETDTEKLNSLIVSLQNAGIIST